MAIRRREFRQKKLEARTKHVSYRKSTREINGTATMPVAMGLRKKLIQEAFRGSK